MIPFGAERGRRLVRSFPLFHKPSSPRPSIRTTNGQRTFTRRLTLLHACRCETREPAKEKDAEEADDAQRGIVRLRSLILVAFSLVDKQLNALAGVCSSEFVLDWVDWASRLSPANFAFRRSNTATLASPPISSTS